MAYGVEKLWGGGDWLALQGGQFVGHEEDIRGYTHGVGGEEDELLREDGSPYYCCELSRSAWRCGCVSCVRLATHNPNSGLRDGRRAWWLRQDNGRPGTVLLRPALTNPQVLMEWPAFDLAGISSASKERLLLACSADCRGVRDPSCRGHAMKTHAVEGGGGG